MRKYISIGFVIAVFLSVIYFIKDSGFLDFDNLQSLIGSYGMLAPIVFGILYILITIFGISAALFTVLAGTIFGTLNGLIIVVISATISATIAFYIARVFREKVLGDSKDKTGFMKEIVSKIEKTCENEGFRTIAILRLTFLPYIPLSYAAGLVRKLKASDFILATFITNIFGSFFFIYFGDKLGNIVRGDTDIVTILTLVGAIVLLVLFIVYVPKITKKFDKNNS